MIEKVYLLTLFNSSFLLKTLKKTHFQIILLLKKIGLKGIDMKLSYREVYIKTIFAIIKLSRDNLCNAEMLTRASSLSQHTLFVLPFHRVNVLIWV